MSSNSPEAQDLLRLFKCVVDTGADVLVPFAERKLLKSYNGNFERFLDDKKHEIFHLWQSKKLLCCECPSAGCNLKRKGHMDNWIFKKMYDDKGNEEGGHIVRNSGKIEQVCLHKYVTRTIGIDELDISALSFLLRNLATLLTNETTALDTITTYRSHICHAYSLTCYDMALLNRAWTGLENALVELTDPSYKRLTKKQIQYLRKVNLEKEEIQELLKNVEKGITEVNNCLISNNNAIEKCETTVKESKDEIMNMLNTNQMEMNKQLENIVQMIHQIKSTAFTVKYEKSPDLLEGDEERLVLLQLATPQNWNAVEIEQMLTMLEDKFKDLQLKIRFVRIGSLVIMTTVSSKVVENSTAFQSAVNAFLTRMVEVCNIDTSVKCNVDVTLHILNSNELNVTYSLPIKPTDHKFVQTDDTSGESGNQMSFTKQRTLSEQYDIAFLNSDNYNEIMWVKRASILLEDTFGIKCALPGRDYLFGLPINELDIYFNQFKAVIVTLTKESHIALKYVINTFESSIVVELDYMKKIPFHLINIPHINGTSCEHLWFSQLFMEIRKRHPDLENKFAPKQINEEPVLDCKSCTSIASTAVYHKLTFVPDPSDARIKAVFCGSLITESFIINLCNNLSNCKDPVHIRRWKKTTDVPSRIEKQDIAIVFVSKYLKTCDSIEKCFISPRKSGKVKWYSTRIEETEIPTFITNLTEDINVPSMNQDMIAVEITTLLKNLMSDKLRHKTIDSSLCYDEVSESQRNLKDSTFYYDEYSETYRNVFESEASLRMKDIPHVYTDPFTIESGLRTTEISQLYMNPFTKEAVLKTKEKSHIYQDPYFIGCESTDETTTE